MLAVALKGLWGRKLRASLTAIAIVLGVAMVSGTYILTDTIRAAFNTVFSDVYAHTSAVITGRNAIGNGGGPGGGGGFGAQVPSLPGSLLARVRALPGVAVASGAVSSQVGIVGHDGKVISHGGAPGLGFSYNPAGQRFNPLTLVRGAWPTGPGEVAIDAHTASDENFHLGQRIGIVARGPEFHFRIVGTTEIAGVPSLGGATMAIFALPEAQRIFDKRGVFDSISIGAAPGTAPQQLVREIQPLLPTDAQVRTGAQQAAKQSSNTSGFLSIFQDFLLAFGGIALFVGSFVIANTLSITIAQRTRELATLRTLGASRRQVRRSVMLEALVIGVIASVVGLFAGFGLAKGLNSLLGSLGIDLPQASTVFKTRTVIVSLLVGVIVTLLAAMRPALRATRVPPIAAVREGSLLPPSRFARLGPYAAGATLAGALALLLVGLFVSGLQTGTRLLSIGVGAAALFVGVSMFASKVVPPLARLLGAPAARFGGAAGSLARSNAIRDPNRTAQTASALMIGLALVTLVGVLAAGLRTRLEDAINQQFRADYALTATDNFTPIGIASANALRRVPGVLVVSGVRAGRGKTSWGDKLDVSGVSPSVTDVIHIPWKHGNDKVPAELGDGGAILSQPYASANHANVGTHFTLEVPSGRVIPLVVRGIYNPPKGGGVFGDVTISTHLFDAVYQTPQNVYTFVNMAGGVTRANTRLLSSALASYPNAKLQTEAQFKHNQEQGLTTLLNLLYVLLSLSIVISLFGIVNTLVLTVFERTREIGMLRAVGMTRRQTRRMIRHESVITALLGAAIGIPLGIVLAIMVGVAIKFSAVTIPVGTVVVFVFAAIVAGLIAAILPARRAGRLNVLEALQYE